jgi:hypothetical protein
MRYMPHAEFWNLLSSPVQKVLDSIFLVHDDVDAGLVADGLRLLETRLQ